MAAVPATLVVGLVIISIMTGSSIMTSSIAEQHQLSFAQQSGNKSLQSDNEVKEKNNKAIVIAFTEAFNTRNASVLDNLVAQNVIE